MIGRALVRHPPHRGVLDWDGLRVVRVDLHDPAEAVGLVRFLREVEPRVVTLPAVPAHAQPVARMQAAERLLRQTRPACR